VTKTQTWEPENLRILEPENLRSEPIWLPYIVLLCWSNLYMEDKRFTVLQYYLALHLSTSLSQYLSTSVLQYISTLVPQYISISVPQTLDFDHLVCPVLLNTQLSSLIRSPIVPKLNFRLTSSLHSPNPL